MENIPKFRAEIDFNLLETLSIEDFDGNKFLYGVPFHKGTHIKLENNDEYPVIKDTWAIHFAGMNDKNSVEIFAGLRVNNAPDRRCGDLVKLGQHKGRVVQQRGEIFVNSSDSYAFYSNHKDGFISKFEWEELEVIGVQQ